MKRAMLYLSLMLVAGILFSFYAPSPVGARFSDTERAQIMMTSGEWVTPKICHVCPCWGISGSCMWIVTVTGVHLADTVQADLSHGDTTIQAGKITAVCDSAVICTFNLSGVVSGTYGITVRSSSGIECTRPDCFRIFSLTCPLKSLSGEDARMPPETPLEVQEPQDQIRQVPQVDQEVIKPDPDPEEPMNNFSIVPTCGISGNTVDMAIEGGPFSDNLQARLKSGAAEAWSLQCGFPATTRMECRFNLFGLPLGLYELQVLDYSGNVIYRAGYFEVK